MTKLVNQLIINLDKRFSAFLYDPVYKAAAIFMDTKLYKFKSTDEIIESIEVLTNQFLPLLEANGCEIPKLNQEFRVLFSHVVTFLSKAQMNKHGNSCFNYREKWL